MELNNQKNGDLFLEVIREANGNREKERDGFIKLFHSTEDDELEWWCALGCVLAATKLKKEMPK